MERAKEIAWIGRLFEFLSLALAYSLTSNPYPVVKSLTFLCTAVAALISMATMKSGRGFPSFLKMGILESGVLLAILAAPGISDSAYLPIVVMMSLTNEVLASGLRGVGVRPHHVRRR